MRVSVQLIEAETGAHLWAERFYLVRARWPTPERPHSLKREPPREPRAGWRHAARKRPT